MTASPATRALEPEPRELYVRHARKNGRRLMSMTALAYDDGACVVDVRLGRGENEETDERRAFRFVDAQQATTFVTEAVEALIYLGCEIRE